MVAGLWEGSLTGRLVWLEARNNQVSRTALSPPRRKESRVLGIRVSMR
jgi:hypothetical protein